MNREYLQNLRYKLQKNFRRLNGCNNGSFHFFLTQFFNFIKTPPFCSIAEELTVKYPTVKEKAESIFKKIISGYHPPFFSDTIGEHTAFSYWIIKQCVESEDKDCELKIALIYFGKENRMSNFIYNFIEPLYEYLDESLDDSNAISYLLVRYKHRCEWFHHSKLLALYSGDTKVGEKNLSYDLYEYLFDQGVDFSIEEKSASGEPDLICRQSDNPLVLDAKIFEPNGSRNKKYILKGFRQVYQYTLDYNKPFGYLVIFKVCEKDLKFNLNSQSSSVQYVNLNSKTIFFIVIDIYEYEQTASKRGELKAYVINESDLIQEIFENNTEEIAES